MRSRSRRILLFGFLAAFLPAAVQAQGTPDGESPAAESICDELVTATPGLFGLCVAFCEAQDCDPDFTQEDPFEHCTPSNPNLLGLYNFFRDPAIDPAMPCLKTPCPCYDGGDLAVFAPPYNECRYDRPFAGTSIDSQLNVRPGEFASIRNDPGRRVRRCIYRAPGSLRVFGFLNDAEVAACREVLHAFMDDNVGQCLTVNDFR